MEIKFRGINHETGEFVYGWYTKLCSGARTYDAIISDINGSLVEFYIHDSKTIGQFTGLKDKNGVEVYKGDIITAGVRGGNVLSTYLVEFDSIYGCWYGSLINSQEIGNNNCRAIGELRFNSKVIGNIHQNPELLNA